MWILATVSVLCCFFMSRFFLAMESDGKTNDEGKDEVPMIRVVDRDGNSVYIGLDIHNHF